MSKCPDCEKGPLGHEGHSHLFSEAMTQGQVQFKCAVCGTVWSRRYMPGGLFEWGAAVAGGFGGVRLPKALNPK